MESIRRIYKIGSGPSSSHTMGPRRACRIYQGDHPAEAFRVTLYGSLAATGKGHLTDAAIEDELSPATVEIVWKPEVFLPFHPNGMSFERKNDAGEWTDLWTVYSVGGGDLAEEGRSVGETHIYPLTNMDAIQKYCGERGLSYWEYVQEVEGKEVFDYLAEVWDVMMQAIQRGLVEEGVLPGGLGLQRKASSFFVKSKGYQGSLKSRSLIYSYALAVSEENASGGRIVTAPTCGSCGIVPAVLYHLKQNHDFDDRRIIRALATAGLFGSIAKHNASISGAEVGCQGEVGVACAMAAAAASQLFGGTIAQIEYAAEMGLEHHLGLTCDPVCGLVQVPCIERNAFAAVRALDSCTFAALSDGKHLVSYDKVVHTMKETGNDLPSLYKETSEGGLAKSLFKSDF